MEDVLGLITSLRDERQCGVLLLLNEEKLGDGKESFNRHFEKVIDNRLVFAPSAPDAAEIAIKGTDEISRLIRKNCVLLNIANIRVIKKIERLIRSIEPLIAERSDTIKEQTVHTLTILGWTKYQPDKAPPFDFYEANPFGRLLQDEEQLSPDEVSWSAIVDRYQFTHLDDYDTQLLAYVKSGVSDDDAIRSIAAAQDVEVKKRAAHVAIERGFRVYHNSFEDNVDDVVKSIRGALEANHEYVSLDTLNDAVALLKSIDRPDDALALLRSFEQNQKASFWNQGVGSFRRPVTDPDVRAVSQSKQETTTEEFDLAKELIRASESLNAKAQKRLADQLNGPVMYSLIKARQGEDMRSLIYAGLEFAKYANASDDMRKILRATNDALVMIAKDSKLNEARVKVHGVNIVESQSPTKDDEVE